MVRVGISLGGRTILTIEINSVVPDALENVAAAVARDVGAELLGLVHADLEDAEQRDGHDGEDDGEAVGGGKESETIGDASAQNWLDTVSALVKSVGHCVEMQSTKERVKREGDSPHWTQHGNLYDCLDIIEISSHISFIREQQGLIFIIMQGD